MFICACLLCYRRVVADGVVGEEEEEDPGVQEFEQELPEDFDEGKSDPFPLDHVDPNFQTQPVVTIFILYRM